MHSLLVMIVSVEECMCFVTCVLTLDFRTHLRGKIPGGGSLLVACEFKGQKSSGGGGSGNEATSHPGLLILRI